MPLRLELALIQILIAVDEQVKYGAAAYWDDVQRTLKTDWSMKKVAEYKSSIQIKNVCIPLYCILNDLLK